MKIDRDLVIVNIGIGNDGDHAAIVLRNTSRTIATTKKQFDCSLVIYRSSECTCRRKNDFVTGCSCVQRRGISSDGVCGTRIYRKWLDCGSGSKSGNSQGTGHCQGHATGQNLLTQGFHHVNPPFHGIFLCKLISGRMHQPFLVTKPYHGKATAFHKYVVKWGRFDIKDEWTVYKKTRRY